MRADLEALKEKYFKQTMGEIQVNTGSDYKYRSKVPREAMAEAMHQITMDLDYSNFKNSVADNQGYERASVYGNVWETLYSLKYKESQKTSFNHELESLDSLSDKSHKNHSYGGVLINQDGKILLRKPVGEFDGYVWTFPKGRNEDSMTAEETAIEEVLQETGYDASIIYSIPGVFKGGTGVTEYFLMYPEEDPKPFDETETQSIKWVSREEAYNRISQTRNEVGRKRDLSVLEATTKTYDRFKKEDLFKCYEKIITFLPATEPFESVELVESFRQYWRPENVRVILLAESHVFTSQTENSYRTKTIESLPDYPDRYARFVYCLSYGEKTLILDKAFQPKEGTPQYWEMLYSCINSVESNDTFGPILHTKTHTDHRILNKIQLLNKLKDRGIWLLDTSIVALYNKGEKPSNYDKALKISWEMHTKKMLEDASPEHVIVVGKGVAGIVENDLRSMKTSYTVLEQPNARLSSEEHLNNYQTYFSICKKYS